MHARGLQRKSRRIYNLRKAARQNSAYRSGCHKLLLYEKPFPVGGEASRTVEVRREVNSPMKAAVYVYGVASAAAGIMDLIWGDFDFSHQPIQAFGHHIPGLTILAYITGVWMIAGGAAILWRRSARVGGAMLAVIYFVFTVFWLPRFYTAPHYLGFRIPVYIGVFAGAGTQLITFAAGALVCASLATRSSSWPRTILIARWVFGICSMGFGLGHLLFIHQDTVYVPKWMPLGGEFWTIVTG